MANTEDALMGLEKMFRESFPAYLRQVEQIYTDPFLDLHDIVDIVWEEQEEGSGSLQLPAVALLADTESDPSLRDILYDARITVLLIISDSDKRNVTKKKFRYAKALRRMCKNNRSLRGAVNSAKVETIRWSPTFRRAGENTVFSSGFEAELAVRLPKEGD